MGHIKAFGENFGATVKRASKIVFDNTVSKLAAITVQGAIDELASRNVLIKEKTYTIQSGSAVDSVTAGYTGSVDTTADKPAGTIVEMYTKHAGWTGYLAAGFSSAIVGNTVYISAPKASSGCIVTVVWKYKA